MRDIETYEHGDKKRTNNPPVGMAQHDKTAENTKTYDHISTAKASCLRHKRSNFLLQKAYVLASLFALWYNTLKGTLNHLFLIVFDR